MTASLVQSAINFVNSGTLSTTLGSVPTVGNLLVASLTLRSGGATWPAGWRDDFLGTTHGSGTGDTHIRSRIVRSGDSAIVTVTSLSDVGNLAIHEYSGFGTVYSSAGADGAMGNYSMTVPTVTAPADASWVLLFLSISGWPDVGGASTTTPYTARQNSYSGGAPGWRYGESADRVRANDLSSYGGETVYGTDGNNFKATLVVYAPLPEPNPCNPRIIDDFNKMINITSEFQSFDRSNWGPTWVADNIHLGTTSISIDGSVAIIDADLANDAANLHTEALNLPFELWMLTNSDYSIRFKVGSIPDGSTGNLYSEVVLSVTGPTSGPIIGKARISSSATYGKIFLGASSIVKTDWIDGAWYTILLQRFDASATVKIFDDTSGEPVSPQVTLTSDYSWPIDTGAVITVKTDWTQLNPGSTTIYSNGKTWIATQTGPGAPMGTNSGEASLSDGFTDNVHGQFAAGGHVTGSSGLYTFAFAVDLGSSKSVNSASIYWYSAIGFELGRVKYSDTGTSGPWTEIVNSGLANPTNFTFTPASHRYWQITIEHSYVSLTYWAALFSGGDSLVELRISGLPPRYQFYLDNLYAGCVETATVLPTPSAGFGVYTRDRMLLSIRASFTDDNLYNHALVIGTGNTSQVFKSEIKDENSLSPTRIAAIGDRVFKYESDQISTQGAADKAAMKVYLANCLISEDVDLEAICNPAFEGNDVIAVQELTFSELNQKFRIRAFTVPLSTSRQTFKLSRVIAI